MFASSLEESWRLYLIAVDFLDGSIDDRITIVFIRFFLLFLCAGFFLLSFVLLLLPLSFQNGSDFSEIEFIELNRMGILGAQRFGEDIDEILPVYGIRFVISADSLAPIPRDLFFIGVQTK